MRTGDLVWLIALALLVALLAVPATNYLSSWTIANLFEVGSGWWRLIVSINSGALLGAFAIYVALALGAAATKTRVGGAPTGRRLSVPDRSVRSGAVTS